MGEGGRPLPEAEARFLRKTHDLGGKASTMGFTSLRETPAPGLEGLVWGLRLSPRLSPPPRGMSPDAK